MKKIISFLLVTMIIISMSPSLAFADDTTIDVSDTYDIGDYGSDSIITIDSELTVTLTNINDITYTNMQIVCGDSVNLTLEDVKIDNHDVPDVCALSFSGANNQLILDGASILHSGANEPGIRVENETELEILMFMNTSGIYFFGMVM